jgi:hypothetical protein
VAAEGGDMSKDRLIPENRIKRIEISRIHHGDMNIPAHVVEANMMDAIGREIAAKLFEFHKVKSTERRDYSVEYEIAFDVIVPDGAPK